MEPDFILSHLEKIRPPHPALLDVSVKNLEKSIFISCNNSKIATIFTIFVVSMSLWLPGTVRHCEHMTYVCYFLIPTQQTKESGEDVVLTFIELVQTLLKDPEERRDFFMVRQYYLPFCETKSNC